MALDRVNNRIFVPDQRNGRVVVFPMNEEGGPASPYASNVLGKNTLISRYTANTEASETQTLHTSGGTSYDAANERLFVFDNPSGGYLSGTRGLVFDATPDSLTDGQAANHILIQPDFRSRETGLSENRLSRAGGHVLDEANQRLFISDAGNNRVLVFDVNADRLQNDPDAYVVIGQSDFSSNEPGLGPNSLFRPAGLVYDTANERLFVGDDGNQRILVFDVAPQNLETGMAASAVVGQPDFESRQPRTDPTRFSPGNMSFDPRYQRLFVVDDWRAEHQSNSRILVFDVHPDRMVRMPEASHVIGQPDFNTFERLVSRNRFMLAKIGPNSVDPDRQLLYVVEGYLGGNRVTTFDIHPDRLSNGADALHVFGQVDEAGNPDFQTRAANAQINGRVGARARAVVLDKVDHRLFVTDGYNNRVLVFQLDRWDRVLEREATWVIGQPSVNVSELVAVSRRTVQIPLALEYDEVEKHLFVADGWGNRVMVFDAHPDRLANYPEALYALGQQDFESITRRTTQDGFDMDIRLFRGITPSAGRIVGLAIDQANRRLFVSDANNSRVMVFDITPERMRTGAPAITVLGQPDFVTSEARTGRNGMNNPGEIYYDDDYHRVFVNDVYNNRILAFDARPEVLTNGMAASHVIGQPDFGSTMPRRTRRGLNQADGLALDLGQQKLFVTDLRNDRLLVFDVHPDRLENYPEAIGLLGQENYESRGAPFSRANQLYSARGIEFDEEYQRLWVTDSFWERLLVFDFPRVKKTFDVAPASMQTFGTIDEGGTETGARLAGYAVLEVVGDPSGTAPQPVIIYSRTRLSLDEASGRESRVVISEAAVKPGPATAQAMVYITDGQTLLSLSNVNDQGADVRFEVRDSAGRVVTKEIFVLGPGEQVSTDIGSLEAQVGEGSVWLESTRPLGVVALHQGQNGLGEEILSAAPVYRDGEDRALRQVLSRVSAGGGYRTRIVLMNPFEHVIQGDVQLLDQRGAQWQGAGGNQRRYRIEGRGVWTWDVEDASVLGRNGYAVISASGEAPKGGGLIRFGDRSVISQTYVEAKPEVARAWIPVDTYPNPIRHGKITVRVAVANAGHRPAMLSMKLVDLEGREVARVQKQLVSGGSWQEWEVGGLFGVHPFKGVWVVQSDLPLGIAAEQETTNVRGEIIATALPYADARPQGSSVLIPEIVDGDGFTTQLYLINNTDQAMVGTLRFQEQGGDEWHLIVR
ncbi:MAG: hypothetical protein AAEI08_07285 [Gammaproteobacteria bacterium]